MQFNVAQLLMDPIGSTRTYDLAEDLSDLDSELEILGPLVGKIQIMRIHSGIFVRGALTTAARVTCNRCLFPIVTPVRFRLEESFRPLTDVSTGRYLRPEEFEGDADVLEDDALIINEQHILDLTEVIRQNVWLALPMAPKCNWEGPEKCPNFLEHLSELEGMERGPYDQVEIEEDTIDPRWAALLQLRNSEEDSDRYVGE